MLRYLTLSLILLLLPMNIALADMKYTQVISSNMDYRKLNAPAEIIQGMQANANKTETFYIKKNKMRKDLEGRKSSEITRCDRKQTIILEHDIKKYVIAPLKVGQSCNNKDNRKSYKHQGSFKGEIKTVITDTKKTEMIGPFKTRKYNLKYSVSGNSKCIPDMSRTETIWIANIKNEYPQCLLNNCESSDKKNKNTCANHFKVIHQGPSISQGLVIKKAATVKNPFDKGNKTITTTTLIKNISTKPLPDSLFEIPKDYTRLSE